MTNKRQPTPIILKKRSFLEDITDNVIKAVKVILQGFESFYINVTLYLLQKQTHHIGQEPILRYNL